MRRLLIAPAALAAGLMLLAPAALAAEPMAETGRVLVSTRGDVTIPDGEQADLVVVVSGTADIQGVVNTLVVVDGTANLETARIETVVAVRSHVEVGNQTVVLGELKRLDSTVHQSGDVQIQGGITDLAADFTRFGAVLGPALALLWAGFVLAMVVAALLVAGLATRQVREAGRLISTEPLATGLTGLLGAIVLPIGAVLLIVTLVGAPLGAGVLFGLLPVMGFVGYVVAAIWLGEWILLRAAPGPERARPYLAAVIGVLVLEALVLVPALAVILVVASLLGFGAVIRLASQALRGTPRPYAAASRPAPAATGA
jgi:hypothetical protein